MKKTLIAIAALLCAGTIMLQAQDAPAAKTGKKTLTPEQQAVMKDILAKYDTNKDGKLDKDERAKISQEDKDKMAKAGLTRGKKAAADKAAAPAADANK